MPADPSPEWGGAKGDGYTRTELPASMGEGFPDGWHSEPVSSRS